MKMGGRNMELLEKWRNKAYDLSKTQNDIDNFWNEYYKQETKFYNTLLRINEHPILDTLENFANKFKVDIVTMIGLVDGINDSLKTPNNLETLTKNTIVTLDYDAEKLYKSCVDAQATHITSLSIWDEILPDRDKLISKKDDCVSSYIPQQTLNIPHCPICNSTNLSKITTTKKVAKIAAFGIFGMGDNGKTWKCNNCGSKF